MAEIKVNPTRMELKKLKGRLATARRGHKLLKDKRDELMKQFLDVVREAKALREELGDTLSRAEANFRLAAAESDPRMLTEALMLPGIGQSLTVSTRNVMSVNVPVFHYDSTDAAQNGGAVYGFAFTSGELDEAVSHLSAVTPRLIHLAELEKSALLMCDEIERTRRRVNALEYIMIPSYESAIKAIATKLDENERGNTSRLMKVKDMMIAQQLQAKHHEDEEDEDTDEAG